MIKYYLFYLDPDIVELVPGAESYDGCLYAYTDNKKICNEFISSRNMGCFRMEKRKLDKKDIHYLAEFHQRKILRIRTVPSSNNGYDEIQVPIAITDGEWCTIGAEFQCKMVNHKNDSFYLNPLIFNTPILYSLAKFDIFEYCQYHLMFTDSYMKDKRSVMLEELSDKCVKVPDYLATFIHLFSVTLNLKGDKN